jgi:hypothetical protein
MCDFSAYLSDMEVQADRELGEAATAAEVEAHERQIAEDLADFDQRIAALIGENKVRVAVPAA